MPSEAPYDYIREYYEYVHDINAKFPDVARFWLRSLRHVCGDAVLNVGCGPQLYDYLVHFGRPPRRYVGVDINRSTFEFLDRSGDPRLLAAVEAARTAGTTVEHLCADVFDLEARLRDRFDCVLGVGFFGTFEGDGLGRLMRLMRAALHPGGTLVKISWHGRHRTAEQARCKLEYRYDSTAEPTTRSLVADIERAGFELVEDAVLECDPHGYGWDAVQVCRFRRS